jgi:hypothetical protein
MKNSTNIFMWAYLTIFSLLCMTKPYIHFTISATIKSRSKTIPNWGASLNNRVGGESGTTGGEFSPTAPSGAVASDPGRLRTRRICEKIVLGCDWM